MITYFNDDSKFDPFIEECLNALIPDGLDNARNYYLADGDRIAFCSQELASNLAHELVHARQFLRGEINEYNYVWKGQDYENQNYEDWPWEVEAYSLEQPLVDLFWENV